MYNRVTLRFKALRRATSTLATPTKAEIIRIKKNKGRHLTKTVPYGPTKRQRLRPRSYVAGGVTRLSSCNVMHRRHSDVCDVLRGCSDATTSCITYTRQANTPAAFAPRCEAVCSVSPKFSWSPRDFRARARADRMRSRTSMHTSRTSGHDLEDFRPRPQGLPGTP